MHACTYICICVNGAATVLCMASGEEAGAPPASSLLEQSFVSEGLQGFSVTSCFQGSLPFSKPHLAAPCLALHLASHPGLTQRRRRGWRLPHGPPAQLACSEDPSPLPSERDPQRGMTQGLASARGLLRGARWAWARAA